MVLWNIWNSRKKQLHRVEEKERLSLVTRIQAYLDSFKSVRFHFALPSVSLPSAGWQRPSDNIIKINFDGAVLGFDFFLVAVVARESEGCGFGWSVRKFRNSPSPVIAEACASRHAILMARAKEWHRIQVEGDCLQVVNAITEQAGDRCRPFDIIIEACLDLSSSFDFSHCSFIRQVGNFVLLRRLRIFPFFRCC